MAALQRLDFVFSLAIYTFALAFLGARVGEWSLVVLREPLPSLAILVLILLANKALPRLLNDLTFGSLTCVPSLRLQLLAVCAGVFYYWDVKTALRSDPQVDLTGKVAVITGANSGIGFHTTVALLARNATVVMACRSEKRCSEAATRAGTGQQWGRAVPMVLDLGDLASVHMFSRQLPRDFPRVDIIVNNAGFNNAGSIQPEPPTKQGLESHIGSMHVGHFVLTELLLEHNLRGAEGVAVVNVASGMHHMCSLSWFAQVWSGGGSGEACLPKSFLEDGFAETGLASDFLALPQLQAKLSETLAVAAVFNQQQVVGDQRYNRAKLANVLHAAELPRRHPGLFAASVDLGFVVTNVTSLMRWMQVSGALPPLQSLGIVRLAAPHGIRPVLLAACWPFAQPWFKSHALSFPNGGLVDPKGDASEPFVIEQGLEELFGVSHLAPNRTALAAALFDATAAVMASFKGE